MNINKAFREKVDKCVKTTFGPIIQPYIIATLPKNKTRVLALLIFYDTRVDNPKKAFKVLSCVIYTMIKNMSVLII